MFDLYKIYFHEYINIYFKNKMEEREYLKIKIEYYNFPFFSKKKKITEKYFFYFHRKKT